MLDAVVSKRTDANRAPAPEILERDRDPCGKSEHAPSIVKREFAGWRLPGKRFGADATWWLAMILSLKLVAAMKHVGLGAFFLACLETSRGIARGGCRLRGRRQALEPVETR